MERVKLLINKVRQFLIESKVELKKVTWPTSKQTLASTSVVIVVVIIVSVFLGLVDFGLTKIIRVFLG
ncbi:MAG: preprotein translocase subunit SecE [Deltaproteobacteria bacterium]|nr:preprotein translocase subunit SecE [Deltaproteobacteria bacterium]